MIGPIDPALVAAFLRRVHARLEDPSAWTKDVTARTVDGHRIEADAGLAVRWSLDGALLAESRAEAGAALWYAARLALYETLGLSTTSGLQLAGWNDFSGRTHDEVLGVLLFTAARLERATPTTGAAA